MVNVREARIEDADAIARVHVLSWQAAYKGLVPDQVLDGLSIAHRAERWNEWLTRDPERSRDLEGLGRIVAESNTWVAEEAGEIVGFVNAGPSRDDDADDGTGEVQAIYVLARCWDLGVGAQLMSAALAWLRERFTCATLWVLEGNDRGRRFYEKGGWSPDGRVQDLDFGAAKGLPEMRYRIEF